MDVGLLRHRVTLDEPVPDGTPVTFSPSAVMVSLEPQEPSPFSDSKVTYRVRMRYHPQITVHTRLTTELGQQLWVRGYQNVEMKNRELVLDCEEADTP